MRSPPTAAFARMMVTVAFAPGHRVRAFFGQDQRPSFLDKRRAELDFFMQRIMLFPDVAEFAKPNAPGSQVLADFVQASQYMDCSGLAKVGGDTGVSPTTTISSVGANGLRDSSTSNPMGSSRGFRFGSSIGPRSSDESVHSGVVTSRQTSASTSSRRACKLEIEEELTLRFGEHQLKRFKKRARAVRKENDPVAAAKAFVAYLDKEFEPDFARWLLRTFIHSLKSDELRRVLRAAGGIAAPTGSRSSDDRFRDDDDARQSKKCGT